MINKHVISEKISDYIITNSNITDPLEKDKILYGVQIAIWNFFKFPIIFLVAYFLGLFKYTLLTLFIFGMVRTFAHGLHMKTSLGCLILSIATINLIPILAVNTVLGTGIKVILIIATFILFFLYAPSDTESRPIIDTKLRKKLKVKSIIAVAILYASTLFITHAVYVNIVFYSIALESLLITPFLYRLFKLRYDNFKYLKGGEFVEET